MRISFAVFVILWVSATADSIDIDRHDDLSPDLMMLNERSRRMTTQSVLEIRLVNYNETKAGDRTKRATWNTFAQTWPYEIPYKFDPSFPNEYKQFVRDAMSDIMERVCITWIESPDFDPQNTKNVMTDAYLDIRVSGSCKSKIGRGKNDKGRRVLTSCPDYESVMRVLLRSLGAIKENRGPLRDNYMTLVTKNIIPGSKKYISYKGYGSDQIISEEFDASSIMHLKESRGSVNGLDVVLPYRQDQFDLNGGRRVNLENNYYELNTDYECDYFCNDKVDCGLGYYGVYQGKCRCICPEGFDFRYNCATLAGVVSGPWDWPDAPFMLHAGGENMCPKNLHFRIFSRFKNDFLDQQITFCVNPVTKYRRDMGRLPRGNYCVYKPLDLECNGGFKEYPTDLYPGYNWYSFSIGDYLKKYDEVNGNGSLITIKMCCRSDKNVIMDAITIPRGTRFDLPVLGSKCTQKVKEMRHEMKSYLTEVAGILRIQPYKVCHYKPAVYGCDRNIVFSDEMSSVTIETPGFQDGRYVSNRRCLFYFNPGKGNRVKVTFNTFDLDSDDEFYIRRFNQWSLPQIVNKENFRREFISEKDFLFMEYWSASRAERKRGLNFTAIALLEKNSCYDVKTKGANYVGQKHVTEDFEECLPWSDALDCEDFQSLGSKFNIERTTILDLVSSGNACRNPGGAMERPFCYTSVTRGMCRKALCDVCNDLEGLDQTNNCTDLLEKDPEFCRTSLQRYQCPESCGFNVWKEPFMFRCSRTSGPSDGTPNRKLQSQYNVGDILSFRCNHKGSKKAGTEMRCTEKGWTDPGTACDNECKDITPLCVEALKQVPELCSKESLMMSTYCSKSCGMCPGNKHVCPNPKGQNYQRASPEKQVSLGQIMEFVCVPGTYLLEGKLKRVCGLDGTLLGKEPVCSAGVADLNIGLTEVLPRSGIVPLNTMFLVDTSGFRIPNNGKITHWHFYGVKTGEVKLVVYRRENQKGSMGKIVDYNTINIDNTNRKWTVRVPVKEQISVEVGDLYGIYTSDGLIAANLCNDRIQKLVTVRTGEGNPDERGTKGYNDLYCMFLSLGVTVEPTKEGDTLPNCLDLMNSDPLFCMTGQERNKCSKTCSLPRKPRCQDEVNNGIAYMGDRHIAEKSDFCVPWKDAARCNFFPFANSSSIDVEKDSKWCRNRGSLMSRPWCFVSGDAGSCRMEYCNVCPYHEDKLPNCQDLKSSIPKFCDISLQRIQCSKTCLLSPGIDRTVKSCKKPAKLPNNAILIGSLKSEYKVNEFISMKCDLHPPDVRNRIIKMRCTENGWPEIKSICSECPDDWTPHNRRCLQYWTLYNQKIINLFKMCRTRGSRAFQILNQEDVREVTRLQNTNDNYFEHYGVWLDTKLSNGDKWMRYEKSSLPTPYVTVKSQSWSPAKNVCVALYNGVMKAVDCNTYRAYVMCQVRRELKPVNVVYDILHSPNDLPKNTVFLFDLVGYRIPIEGKVSHWHFYGVKEGDVHFVVYRRNYKLNKLEYVGYNTVTVTAVNARWTSYVEPDDQFNVQLGDVIGVFSTDGLISFTLCDDTSSMVWTHKASSIEEVSNGGLTFKEKRCVIPNIGFRVIPDEKDGGDM